MTQAVDFKPTTMRNAAVLIVLSFYLLVNAPSKGKQEMEMIKFCQRSALLLASLILLPAGPVLAAAGLSVKGSTTLGPVFKEIGGKFGRENKVPVNVQGGGSGEGVKCAREKTCDIGLASKAINGKDAEGLTVTHFGWDGLVFVVNSANPIADISQDQAKDIFALKKLNWKDLGQPEAPIVAIARTKDAGESDFFKHQFKNEAQGTESVGPNDAVVVKVSKNKSAISFMSLGIAEKNLSRGLKILSVDGKKASTAAVSDGSYPLRRELVVLSSKDNTNPDLKKFIDFALVARKTFFTSYGFVSE